MSTISTIFRYILVLSFSILCIILHINVPSYGQGSYPASIKPKSILRAPVLKPGQVLNPGDLFRDCDECPDMVVLPAGGNIIGSNKYQSERPTRFIHFDLPFAIGRFEVQHSEWQICVDQKGCVHQPDDHDWGRDRMPVINVNFGMVQNYIGWLSKKTGQTYRLPSEAEWEYAARANSKTNFWFGEGVGSGNVNCRKCGSPWSGIGNAPIGSFEPNPWGLYDMHGNAFEWVEDCWHNNFTGAPSTPLAWNDGDCRYRVIKGGSWYYFSRMSRSANRQKNLSQIKSYWLSFRLVRELN